MTGARLRSRLDRVPARFAYLAYLALGLIVATGILGGSGNYFSGIDTIQEVAELVIAVLLWPLVLLGVPVDITGTGGEDSGGGGGGGGGRGGGGRGG